MAEQVSIRRFMQILRDYYHAHGRHDMLWRQPEPGGTYDPYKILVSELMLQQTQVSRVTLKYSQFIARFPDAGALASAQLGEVLQLWNGLGYNRRAKFLWQSALHITEHYGGVFPSSHEDLIKLPGVGPNTAGAILAYAYNQPVVYIETNIRTVFIHHFFADQSNIADSDIRRVMDACIGQLGELTPREFYWALMDYGSHLKTTVGNLNTASRSYTRQSKFAGSRRQLRGLAIRLLSDRNYTSAALLKLLNDDRAQGVLADLESEQLIQRDNSILKLA